MNPSKDTELIFYGGEYYNGDKVSQSWIVLMLNIILLCLRWCFVVFTYSVWIRHKVLIVPDFLDKLLKEASLAVNFAGY